MRQERGSAMLEYLMLVPMLLFLAFYPVQSFRLQVQRNLLEGVKDRYLQVGQLEGGFTPRRWRQLEEDLAAEGFDLSRVEFTGSTPVGAAVRRGEEVRLRIGYPQGAGLDIQRLIGLPPPDPNRLIWVSGVVLSEKKR